MPCPLLFAFFLCLYFLGWQQFTGLQMAGWGGRWHGDPENNGGTFAYCPRYPYGCGYYASPLEPTGLHVLANPTLDSAKMTKSYDGSKLVEEPSNVAGVCSGGEATDLFDCLDRAGQSSADVWKKSDDLHRSMVSSKKLKASKCDDAPTLNSFRELKLSVSPCVMAETEPPRHAPMDALGCPDLALESRKNLGLDTVEHMPRNSRKTMECCSSSSGEDRVAMVPYKSSTTFVETEQAVLGADARTCDREPTRNRPSAVRRFPFGCGSRAPVLTQREVEELVANAKCRTPSSSKTRRIGIGTHSDGGSKSRSPSRFIVKESGREINTSIKNVNHTDKCAASVKKENIIGYHRPPPAQSNKVPSGHGDTASHGDGKELPTVLAKDCFQHSGKAIVGPVNKGKAIFMYQEHILPVVGRCAFQSKNETTVDCYKNFSPQQFEKCRKLIGNRETKPKETDARENVKTTLQYFKFWLHKDTREEYLGKSTRPDLMIFGLLKEEGRTPTKKYLGEVPGVEIGDEFHYRGELMAIGLHSLPVAGIDHTPYNGTRVATCIISSSVYDNTVDGNGVLVYSGEGGNPNFERKRKTPAGDQKLERGNLALWNSRDTKTPVRVIHGFRGPSASLSLRSRCSAFVYDGLYEVEDCWSEMGQRGYAIFKFRLRRLPGQPDLPLKLVKNMRGVKVHQDCRSDTLQVQKEKLIPGIAPAG